MKNTLSIWIKRIAFISLGLLLGWVLFKDHDMVSSSLDDHAAGSYWTCSMHPHIQSPQSGVCPICGMDLVPANEGTADTGPGVVLTDAAVRLANVQTTVVGTRDGNQVLTLNGTVSTNETQVFSQTMHVPGRLENLLVSFEGEQVRRGQKIATVYSPELVTAQEELITALGYASTNPAILNAARNKLALWKLKPSQIKKIEETRSVQTELPIYANVSGIVTKKFVNTGDHLPMGGVMFEVANLSSLWVQFDVYEKDLALLHLGDTIKFTSKALSGHEFVAKIDFIDPVVNASSRTLKIRATIPNQQQLLKPDMFVIGTLLTTAQGSPQISIPKSAVLWTGKRSVVYVKNSETPPTFEMKEITLGTDLGASYGVLDGLAPNDEVVTNGTFTIDAAAQLQGKTSMMNKPTPGTDRMGTSAELELFEIYQILKTHLVKADFRKAKETAGQAYQLLQGNTSFTRQWLPLKTAFLDVSEADNLDHQRAQFSTLSDQLYPLITARTWGRPIYYQHCPMAFNNQGAYWLSVKKEIENPYFGDQMLNCGSTVEVIK